jgi:ABC-type uncharacterized transport system permease subunit
MNLILIEALAAATYLGLAALVWRMHAPGAPPPRGAAWLRTALMVPLSLHGSVLIETAIASDVMHFGFAQALSLTLWLAVLIYWVESFYLRIDGLLAIALPVAALTVLLPAAFPGYEFALGQTALALRLHLLSAIAAYSLFTIAALQALFLALLERRLQQGNLHGIFAQVPPVLTLERVLFQMIGTGLALLTLVVVSGFMFAEEMFGRAFRFDHKTLFAMLSWGIFAALLFGRWRWGWRGRKALRWLLAGFACLLLAYVGSRFVFEVILDRAPT